MPFKPGQSGNPNGRPKTAKPISEALNVALNEETPADLMEELGLATEKGFKKTRAVATRIVNDAIKGNTAAQTLLLDRTEGKVKQTTELQGEVGLSGLFEYIAQNATQAKIPGDG